MFWFITIICMTNVLNAKGFAIQDTYNVLLNDDSNYKVDLVITDDDHEMIKEKELKEFKIQNEQEMFKKLNDMVKMANQPPKILTKLVKDPYEAILPIIVVQGKSNAVITTYIGQLEPTTTSNNKRAITEEEEDKETEYDYDSVVNEYYDEANIESRSKNAYHIRKSGNLADYGVFSSLKKIFLLTSEIADCSEVTGIGFLAFKCLIADYKHQRQPMRDLMARLWTICQIWFFVYLGIAIPLWCTRGWCCCCLCCKFFKPRQTIEEAKKYAVAYPPGVFKNKHGDVVRYEPSEREKQVYEEFEHFIKTI